MKKRIITAIYIILILFIALNLFALNKIRWKQMDWRIYETDHFSIYYYEGEETLAKLSAIFAENAFTNNSKILGYTSKTKIPLFIYENSLDFSTTNITLSYLGEGVGGFTEAFKNRIALPSSGSIKDFRTTITHEITHAIQYNIIFGEGFRSYNVFYKDIFIPVWVMEGLAEYCANDMDAVGEMVLRDAVVNDKIIKLEDMDGFAHLEEPYLAYKQAQSVFDYIEKKYGREKIARFLQLLANEVGEVNAYKKVFMKAKEDFEKEFILYLKKKYWAQVLGRDTPDRYGPKMTNSTREKITYNQSPVFSPDESKIAFISNVDGKREIYIANIDGTDRKKLSFNYYDGLLVDGYPISWSKDGFIYYSVVEKSKKIIMKGNVITGENEKIILPDFINASSPSISPDNNYLAFIGAKGGFTDVYLYDLKNNNLHNLTQNLFENNFVSWSSDGKFLVFTEEREEIKKIIVYDIEKGKMKFISDNKNYNCIYPRFLTNDEIIFVSDKNGIYNLYKLNLNNKNEIPFTNVTNGIFYPCVSNQYIIYSYYEDGCYNIYKYLIKKPDDIKEIPLMYVPEIVEKEKKEKKILETKIESNEIKNLMKIGEDEEFKKKIEEMAYKIIKSDDPYITTFTPDVLLGIFGFSTESGLLGGGYVTLSDMLGNNNISLLANFIPDYYSQFEFEYLYMSLPFDIGFKTFYYQNIYQLFDTRTGEIFSQLNSQELGGSIYFKYPFNIYTSLYMQISTDHITDRYTNFETSSSYLFKENEDNILNSIALYLYIDNTLWRDLWPFNGDFFIAYVSIYEKIFNGTKSYNLYEINYGKYFDLNSISFKNMVYSLQLMFSMTDGEDKPYYILGGLNNVRGMNYGEYISDKVLLLKNELRYILARNVNFNFWPLNFLMIKNIKATIFNDNCIIDNISFESAVNGSVKSSFGFSIMIDTFFFQRQFVPFQFEVAKRIDIEENEWKFYFNMNATY
jgi:Tol biopolymer transport system component